MPQNVTDQKILITGTHHTPAIELIHQLGEDSKTKWTIYYIAQLSSSDTHVKNCLIPLLGNHLYSLESGKFNRYQIITTIFGFWATIKAFFFTFRLLRLLKPDVVVSFGGYISVPVILAAWAQKIPTLTHEQTPILSLSTKINGFFCQKIALSFKKNYGIADLLFRSKYVVTQNLIRRCLFQKHSPLFDKINPKNRPLIYLTGGNQGAHALNQAILPIIKQLTTRYVLIHQTGIVDFPQFSQIKNSNYYPISYVDQDNIGWVFHHASLIISRSGANVCQEIQLFHQKAILIPLPSSQQNEQFENALWLKDIQPDITQIIPQSELTPQSLISSIDYLLRLKPSLIHLKPLPNLKLLKLIHEIT
ncbi:MAG: glycosyltransferase [Candidatus Shapirobacteria bacterium]|jgi:UDP-N-acetylglucosamine--N-acetylmuramyl-(pentapeptide) pyrophosphoryl-undecaprenol N-acetylglucosamine transferase